MKERFEKAHSQAVIHNINEEEADGPRECKDGRMRREGIWWVTKERGFRRQCAFVGDSLFAARSDSSRGHLVGSDSGLCPDRFRTRGRSRRASVARRRFGSACDPCPEIRIMKMGSVYSPHQPGKNWNGTAEESAECKGGSESHLC